MEQQLIVGEYYHIEDRTRWAIFQVYELRPDKDRPGVHYLGNFNKPDKPNFSKNSCVYHPGRNLRKATEEEIMWHKKCSQANKYVPKGEPSYSIFN